MNHSLTQLAVLTCLHTNQASLWCRVCRCMTLTQHPSRRVALQALNCNIENQVNANWFKTLTMLLSKDGGLTQLLETVFYCPNFGWPLTNKWFPETFHLSGKVGGIYLVWDGWKMSATLQCFEASSNLLISS